ncbi:hypothetical protein QAD02_001318 [Eretmocerus hayati]|uniref:Uncharacterized protein n=1 Tax=Eretmocerus hayati TaxID=131215 RepID=A0ACC2NFN8_9HYME|nr:hypothetical protein QAD02_001318 [Eretmocerus hayati]
METFCPPEDANLHPDGPLQKIVIPAEIRSNTERMEYFTSICAALKTPALQACRVAFTRQALIFSDAEREAILDAVIRRNPVPIPITVVSSRPSYAGIRVINKEAYHPPAGIPAPPDGFPNHRLIETLTQGYDPASPVPTQQEIISAIEKRSAKFLYCVNVPFDHLSPAFEGFLEKDPVIQSSHVDPSMNRLVGEAKNFADAISNLIVPHLTSCHCENLPYVLISPNPDADITYSSRQLPAYPCQERNCEFFSRDQTAYSEHTRLEHGVSHPIVAANERFCLACWRKFRVSNAADHISRPIHKSKKVVVNDSWRHASGLLAWISASPSGHVLAAIQHFPEHFTELKRP